MNRDLSVRQLQMLDYLRGYIVDRGYPPSVREIAEAAGLRSNSSAVYQLRRLELKGYIRRDLDINRGLVIVRQTDE